MGQVITNAFEQYWQSSLAAEQPVVLDELVLADIPNLDITAPIDPDTGLPPAGQIVHRQTVDQRGRVNNNAVAYTIVMDTTIGDFSFNAMYLRNKQNGVIGMIVYKGRETKLKTDLTTGQTGNSLVKSMLMGYDQAAEATLTHVDAGTWQIDYAARLRGQDEDLRQLASQLYGHHTFIGDGFKVVQQDGDHHVTPGVAIVGGLRIELKQPEVIYPGTKPIGVWVDVHRSGSLLSEHQNHFTIITSVADPADHVDGNGYQHYVAKLATVQADNTIVDSRRQSGNSEISTLKQELNELKYAGQEEVYDLLITYGQSNSLGYAGGQTATPNTLEGRGSITPLGYYWNGTAVVPLIYDMKSSSGEQSTGNAWVPFANEYCRLTGRRLVVIPCAKGGASIAALQKGEQWYTAMEAYVTGCLTWLQANEKSVGKRWMGFHQGETDQLNITAESDYVNGISKLKDDVVRDFQLNKFVIHFVGYPQNRKETSWDSIINIQHRMVRTHRDVVCGFDACSSFTKQNGMLTADGVHYSQLGFNLMGSTSGRVVAGLVLNDQTNDLRGDAGYTGLKFPKDRFWYQLAASIEKIAGQWVIKDRNNSPSGFFTPVSNIDSVSTVSSPEIRIHTAADISSQLAPVSVSTSLALAELGFKFLAEVTAAREITIRCICDLSFVVKTDGSITSHSGNPLNPILAQLITASYNSGTQNWQVTFAGNLVGAATVTPYGVGSNAYLVTGSGVNVYVNCPIADENKSFVISVKNFRVNFTDFSNIGPIYLSGIGGQPNW